MARPLRIEFEGAVYHITARGNASQDIYLDDEDRQSFLQQVAGAVQRFAWICHGFCLMHNHYHLLIETPQANLSRGMQYINGTYTQAFNRRHSRGGHLLQGRFKAILVEKESHLLELARYIVLNPIRAGLVKRPEEWFWSNYRATAGLSEPPSFLNTSWTLSHFSDDPDYAKRTYREFVLQGYAKNPWDDVKGGLLLGSEHFVKSMRPLLSTQARDQGVPRRERFVSRPSLGELFSGVSDRATRDRRIYLAVRVYQYTLAGVARFLGIHYSTVSVIAKQIADTEQKGSEL